MHQTWGGLSVLTPHRRNSSTITRINSSPKHKAPTLSLNITPSLAAERPHSRWSGSTVWGPGALGGKLMKHIGESVLAGVEHVMIRIRLNEITELQPQLLGSLDPPTDTETIRKICRDLVELCTMEMGYPLKIMNQAFSLILQGFKLPGRRLWTYHIAEAMSRRHLQHIHEIFLHAFFPLLDDSVFRLSGIVDLEIFRYRCPSVAHEIVTIISHLSRRDRMAEPLYVPRGSSESSNEPTGVVSTTSDTPFSTMIVRAQFFQLVRDWEARGFPHWDSSGKEMLEQALQDIADAQNIRGDPEFSAVEALELKERLQAQRYIPLPQFRRTDSLTRLASGDI